MKQAYVKLHDEKDPAAPQKVHCWIVDVCQAESVLWNLSWALNSIGHSMICLTTYDWIMAVKHAHVTVLPWLKPHQIISETGFRGPKISHFAYYPTEA